MQANELKNLICKILDDKKGVDITVIDIGELSIVADYFVIVSGRSTTQVKALANNLEEELSKNYSLEPLRSEGKRDGRWAVVDYGSVVVHVFHEETRRLYSLEQLWGNGQNVTRYEDFRETYTK